MALKLKLFFCLLLGIAFAEAFPEWRDGDILPDPSVITESTGTDKRGADKRNAIPEEHQRWTNATIPYAIIDGDKPFTEDHKKMLLDCMDIWENYTCVKFRPLVPSDSNYVHVINWWCNSQVGMVGGRQQLQYGCDDKFNGLHELGHTLGLVHMQRRADRDDWMIIHWENEGKGRYYSLYQKYPQDVKYYGTLYDYMSIMHYPKWSMAGFSDLPVMEARDPMYMDALYYTSDLSFRDIRIVNLMYSCNAHCPDQTCPGEGFVGKDCKCWCPGNPVQLCGSTPYEAPPARKCHDDYDYCKSRAERGECLTKPNHMLKYCKLSCEVCNPNCEDYDGNCDYYAHTGWCVSEEHRDYMKSTCPMSCRYCDPIDPNSSLSETPRSTNVSLTDPACENLHIYCQWWAGKGECENNSTYMLRDCRVACKACEPCINYDGRCDYFHQRGWCDVDFFSRLCRRSCQKCQPGNP